MEFLQFLGTVAPQLAPTLLISWVLIRVVLEFLKERRELVESHRVERKELRDSHEQLARSYQASLVDITALGRDLLNQMHGLKGEITKYLLDEGRRKTSKNE